MTKPLTLAGVKRLVAAGESETLELERTTGELREAAQALCGFLNQRGGVVLFGVAADGRIVGQEVNDGTLRDVTAAVRDIDPAPQVDVRRVDVGGGRSLVVLRASAGGAAPHTYDGQPFIRIGSTTRRMQREGYERLLLARLHARHRWETLPAAGWSISDLNADEIRQTVVEAVAAKRLSAAPSAKPEAILRRLNRLADAEGVADDDPVDDAGHAERLSARGSQGDGQRVLNVLRGIQDLEAHDAAVVSEIGDDAGPHFVALLDALVAQRDDHRIGLAVVVDLHATPPVRYFSILELLYTVTTTGSPGRCVVQRTAFMPDPARRPSRCRTRPRPSPRCDCSRAPGTARRSA